MSGCLIPKDLAFNYCPTLSIPWCELDFFPSADEKFNKTKVYETHEQTAYCLAFIHFLLQVLSYFSLSRCLLKIWLKLILMGTYHDELHAVLDSSVKGELENSPRIPAMEGTLFSKYHLGLWVSLLQGVWLEI